jgi:hypothetical protein
MQKISAPSDLARELKVDKNHLIISAVYTSLKKTYVIKKSRGTAIAAPLQKGVLWNLLFHQDKNTGLICRDDLVKVLGITRLRKCLLFCYIPSHDDTGGSDTCRFQGAVRVLLPQDRESIGNGLIPVVDSVLFHGGTIQLSV